jgi:hypothetical protein
MTMSVRVAAQMMTSRAGSKKFDADGTAVVCARPTCAVASRDSHRTVTPSLDEKIVEYVGAVVLQRI